MSLELNGSCKLRNDARDNDVNQVLLVMSYIFGLVFVVVFLILCLYSTHVTLDTI
jgi:hypothetical protein